MDGGEERAFGCLFCITGKEQSVADRIQNAFPQIRATAARQEKHKSVNGKKLKIEAVILPGYVFFEAPTDFDPRNQFFHENVIRLLISNDGDWRFAGGDMEFAEFLFKYDGLLGFSKAYQEGDRVRMLSGPLKDMEGQIKRVDRRGRSGQVSITVNGRTTLVWLGFDLIETAPVEQPAP